MLAVVHLRQQSACAQINDCDSSLFTVKHALQFSKVLFELITRKLSSRGKQVTCVGQHEVSAGR